MATVSTDVIFPRPHSKAEFDELKEEMEHKFALQVAENKRIQSNITTLKNENQMLERRVSGLEKRIKNLEDEIIGEEV